ncbi:MAG: prepilin-type N-terminal cleavage/methylation domain-containing protein [Phormidesmis sp.]
MLRRQKYKQYEIGGFTMIELLVVIAMVGTIAAIAAPSWQGLLDRQRMNAARNDLIGLLRNAQDEAQARQQSKQITFLPYSASTPLSVMVRNASSSAPGVITQLGKGEVGKKFRLSASTPTITFDYDGRVDVTTVTTPYIIKITNSEAPASSSPPQSCVIVTTILGGLKPANDDSCDNFDPQP